MNGIVIWNARATSQMPNAIDNHSGSDNANARTDQGRLPHHGEAFGKGPHRVNQGSCRYAPAAPASSDPSARRAVPDGLPAPRTPRARRRPPGPRRCPPRGRRRTAWGRPRAWPQSAASTNTPNSSTTIARSKNRSTMIVANAGGGAAGLPGGPAGTGRSTSPARAGSSAVGREANHRGAERRRQARGADRFQQHLPAAGPEEVGESLHRDRQHQQPGWAFRNSWTTSARLALRRNRASRPAVQARIATVRRWARIETGAEAVSRPHSAQRRAGTLRGARYYTVEAGVQWASANCC